MVSCSDNSSFTITWMGQSMFQIECLQELRIVTDPYSVETGYTPPYTEPDVVTISHYHHDHGNVKAISGSPRIIDKVGFYNDASLADKGISITGISSFHDEVSGAKRGQSIIFKFNCRGLILVHMGDYGQPLTEEHFEILKDADILLIPVGGTYTIDPQQAADIVKRLNPRIVIPMHYRTKHYNRDDISRVEVFTEMMQYVRQKGPSVYVEQARLPEETEVWVMEYFQ